MNSTLTSTRFRHFASALLLLFPLAASAAEHRLASPDGSIVVTIDTPLNPTQFKPH